MSPLQPDLGEAVEDVIAEHDQDRAAEKEDDLMLIERARCPARPATEAWTVKAVLVVGLCLLADPAWSEPIPRIDVDKVCRESISKNTVRFGEPAEQYERCFQEAQQGYDTLKGTWASIPDVAQKKCLAEWSYVSSALYRQLVQCVDGYHVEQDRLRRLAEEEKERRAIPKREFRY